MTGHSWKRRRTWIRLALAVTAAIVGHAFGGASAQAAPIDSRPDIVLAGFTAQHLPVFFKVSDDGRVLLASGIALKLGCTSGSTLGVPDAFAHIPIAANGRLHTTYAPPTTTQNGATYSETDALTGGLNSAHARLTGTWRLKWHITMASGQSVMCDTGLVHFSVTS